MVCAGRLASLRDVRMAQRAEHPGHAPDLNFKQVKAESNAAQKELI